MISIFIGLILLFAQSVALFADQRDYVVKQFGMEQGLPQSTVNDIIQTRDGYLWLATFGGLVRFDGSTFTTYDRSNTPGMRSDRILHMFEDREGAIWLSTEEGFVRFKDGKAASYIFRKDSWVQSPSVIREDATGNLWVIVFGSPFILQNGEFKEVEVRRDSEQIQKAVSDQNGVWLFGEKMLYRTLEDRVYQILDLRDELKYNIVDFTEYPKNSGTYFFASTGEGVIRYRDGEVTFFAEDSGLASRFTWRFYEDNQQNLWVVSYAGKSQWNGEGFMPYDLIPDSENIQVRSLFEDKEDNFWVGSTSHGLFRMRPTFIRTIDTALGLDYESMLSLTTLNDGSIVFATNCGGIYEWDGKRARPSNINALMPNQCVWSVFQDSQDRIWIGSRVLYVTQSLEESGIMFNRSMGFEGVDIFTITEDSKGSIWIGAYNGVFVYDGENFTKYNADNGLSYNDTRIFFEDNEGVMWVGTSLGLNTITDGVVRQFPLLPETHDSQQPYIRAIYQDEDGVMWFGSYGHGIFRIQNDEITQIGRSNGLFDNIVSHIVEDEQGFFWMGSNRGISRVSRKELNAFSKGEVTEVNAYAYGVADGMKSAETNGGFFPNVIKDDEGQLYFPTVQGVAVVATRYVIYDENPNPIYIQYLRTDEFAIDLSDKITISHDTAFLEITYTAINFADPTKTRFRYRMTGLDRAWIDVGNNRTALYSKLPPGEYTFQVQASNNDGIWDAEGASLRIIVIPPFWQKPWFYSLVVLLFLVSGPFVFYIRVKKLKKENETKRRFTEQLIESQENERRRISSELHDSLGQQILVIKNRAELAQLQLKISNKEELANQLKEIMESAQSAISDVRNISHALRPVHLERFGLTEAVENLCEDLKLDTSIKWIFNIKNIDNLIPENKEINFYRVLQEGTNNIQRHSNATEVLLSIRAENKKVIVVIKDNGKGFDKLSSSYRMGLGFTGMHERVENLGGILEVISELGRGTELRITIHV